MSVDITRSNLVPSAKEETVLRALLAQKNEELRTINDIISKAQSAVTSFEQSIERLTQSRNSAREMLAGYEEQVEACENSLETFSNRFSVASSEVLTQSPETWDPVQALLASNIPRRTSRMEGEIIELNSICSKIQAVLLGLDEDLRCQEYIKDVNAKSINIYQKTQEEISAVITWVSGAFRPIKRVPNEIWSDILARRIYQDSHCHLEATGTPLYLPALPISHVCRSWRSIAVNSPDMWSRLHWRVGAGEVPNADFLKLWTSLRGNTQPMVYELQSTVGHHSAAESLGPYMVTGSKDIIYFVQLPSDHDSVSSSIDLSSLVTIQHLLLYAPGVRASRVQPQLLPLCSGAIKLTLSNIMLPKDFIPHNSIRHLTINFTAPHKFYNLSKLLLPSLLSLILRHDVNSKIPALTQPIQLPNLFRLSLTPYEAEIAAKLKIHRSLTLVITSPRKDGTYPDGWLDSFHGLCTTLVHLELDGIFLTSQGEGENSIALDTLQIFGDLYLRSPRLQTVEFTNTVFDGSALADCLEKQQSAPESPVRKLAKITIDKCIGISRMDCERLVTLVGELKVYDTVHRGTMD